jgi:hypothetical protein
MPRCDEAMPVGPTNNAMAQTTPHSLHLIPTADPVQPSQIVVTVPMGAAPG